MSDSQLVDYTVQGFTVPIIREGVKGYASINAEMYKDDDGLDITGTYFVYLLHPVHGSTHFTIEPDNSYHGLRKEGGTYLLEDETIEEIIVAIEEWHNKSAEKINDMRRPPRPVASSIGRLNYNILSKRYEITEKGITYCMDLEHTRLLKMYFRGTHVGCHQTVAEWYSKLAKNVKKEIYRDIPITDE